QPDYIITVNISKKKINEWNNLLYKFIDEGKREHEEMSAFIREFKTTNEHLFKERNNSLSELRGGKTTTHRILSENTDIHNEEPSVFIHDKPDAPKEVLVENEPKKTKEQVVQPSIEGLEKSINQSDLESCDSIGDKSGDNYDLGTPIRRIDPVNTPYSGVHETTRSNEVESEHLYSASANEIDEKKPELKNLPHHLEYAYLHGDKSFPIIISSKLSKKEKMLLLHVLEKHSSCVSPIHVVPKKGGMTVVLNDNNELIPSRTVTRWRVILPNSNSTRRLREDDVHLSFWNFCLQENAV
ncbi:hypothetical protein Tco_0046939, partial [Tanacetum coccineum]